MRALKLFHSARRRVGVAAALSTLTVALVAQPAAAATGPYLVRDINTSGSSTPSDLVEMGGKLYFSAQGGGKGRELWVSDGTEAGTKRVRDIRPGSAGSSPQNLVVLGNLLLFSADSGNGEGRELFRSDGTNAGTWPLADINQTGAGVGSDPFSFYAYGDVAYFSADDGVRGRELWRTQGHNGTTSMVKDIVPGLDSSNPGRFVGLPNRLTFVAQTCAMSICTDTLYRTDGTKRGTKPLRDSNGNLVTGSINWPVAAGGRLFFDLDEIQLWRSNGTAAKTRSLGDIPAWEIVPVGNRVFFRAGNELWRSDGSVAGTQSIKDLGDGSLFDLVDLDGTLFFFSGQEPWTSDGTPGGTQPVGKQVQSDTNFAVLGPVVYFGGFGNPEEVAPPASNPDGVPAPTLTLWRSDGTADGTYSVADTPTAHIRNLTVVGDSIFFTADEDTGTELWRYVP